MRILYMFASYLLVPALLLHLAIRGMRDRRFWWRWRERFGRYTSPLPPGGIVVHAVSVGEINAAAPLVRALLQRYPRAPLTVTCFTPTGSQRVTEQFSDSVHHVYWPVDLPSCTQRFLNHLSPSLLIVMETEIWPNLFEQCARREIPILLANARISEKSYRGYRRLRGLTRPALRRAAQVAAQSEADAQRFIDLGAVPACVETVGNLKFDVPLPEGVAEQGKALRAALGDSRPVFLAASTHEDEEGPVLEAFLGLLETFPSALLILAPRHEERFRRAARRAAKSGLTVRLLSEGADCPASTRCLVVDAMGELLMCYAACDVAFVGGSLSTIGGHNVLEAAALSVPVVVGPNTANFADVTNRLLAAGGAEQVHDAAGLQHAVGRLLADPALRRQMGAAGKALVHAGQGALARTLEITAQLLAVRRT